jgi:hypothetical protein
MPVLRDWKLEITVDEVLRGQGADPEMIRERNPRLVEIAEQALSVGMSSIQPVVAYRQSKIKSLKHERLSLSEGGALSGKTIAQLLAPARQVVLMLCTIGPDLENYASELLMENPSLGLALDGLGTAAAGVLAATACCYFGEQAALEGLQATLPVSPGMDGWPAEQGQPQIFALVDPKEAGIQITSSGMMVPRKSVSLVIGFGPEIEDAGRVCDYCSMRQTCRYQDTYV